MDNKKTYLTRVPRDDEAYSRERLMRILGRRRLTFNPYTVSDEQLMELIADVPWGNAYDIVQMTVVHFTRLRETRDDRGFDGLYMRVGTSEEEVFLHLNTFLYPVTAADTLQQVRSMKGKTPIRSEEDVKGLAGHSYFVSRIIRGCNIHRLPRPAYHFHRLHGHTGKDAATIRRAMTDSRIEMLGRLLAYPEAAHHLDCRRDLFDIETPIQAAMDAVRRMEIILKKC